MVYGAFNGHKVGSDVLLSLSLIQQGLKSITDAYEAKTKRKCLSANGLVLSLWQGGCTTPASVVRACFLKKAQAPR